MKLQYHLLKYFGKLLLVFCACQSLFCAGQSVQSICKPDVINFTKQVYNAQYQNWNIAQDSLTKFMYFANSKGLLEFDGSDWKVYELPQKQKIRSVAVDNKGRIFTGALGEFGYWLPSKSGVLAYHSLKKLVPDTNFPTEEIWNILVTPQGIIFQSFAYIYLYKPQNNQLLKLNAPGNMLFVHEVKNRFFVEIIDKGLYELAVNNRPNEQFSFIKGSDFLGKESVYTILPLQENDLLVGTNKGIYRYDGKEFREFNQQTNAFIQQNQLNRGIYLGNNIYAWGTILNGLILTNQKGEIIQNFNKKSGLQNNTVLSLSEDADGNLWVGMDKGIDLIVLSSPMKYYNDLDGRLGTVYDVAIHQGKIYLGTNQGVFWSKLSEKQADFQLVPKTQGQVWDLEVIDNQLLCGHNNGTFLIEDTRATLISTVTGGWVIKKMKSHPELLIQGTYTKLCIYRKANNGKWIFDHIIDDFSASIRRLEEDRDGNFWVNKAPNGLISLRLSDNIRKVASLKVFDYSELLGAEVFTVNQQIYVTTPKGVLIFNPKKKQFVPAISIQKSLGGEIIRKIFPIFTNNVPSKELFVIKKDGGLSMIAANGKQNIISIKKNQWVDDYENILSIDADNYLLCTENGFVILPKESLTQRTSPQVTKPIIRDIVVQDFSALNHTFRLQNEAPNFVLAYDQNNLTINFCTPNYGSSVKYSYWLENMAKNWNSFQNITHKDFNNLSPGKYIFHLKSDLNPQESVVVFEISQPWYWNFWSRLCYFLALIGVAWLSFQLHLRRVKSQQEQVREKLEKQLERQAEISSGEIMQLRNEQLEKNIISKSEELANSTMAVIKKNELLLTIKQGLTKLKTESEFRATPSHFNQVLHLVDSNISTEHDWQVFENNFNQVHEEFIKKLLKKYPNLTPSDLKLAAYLRMNLSTKEIAHLLNITNRSVELKRYRLRKKMNLESEVNLGEFMMGY